MMRSWLPGRLPWRGRLSDPYPAGASVPGVSSRLAFSALSRAGLLILLSMALWLPMAPQAQAQTTVTLVSNTGKTSVGANTINSSFSFAQAFDTGSNAGGYNLGSIVLSLVAPTGSGTFTATVRADDSGNPSSTVLYTLTNPTLGHGLNEFTAPANATLDAGATYHVVLAFSEDSGGPRWTLAAISQGLDAGASPGWDIDSGALRYSATQTTWSVVASSQSFQLQVKGSLPATFPDAPTGLMANPEDAQVTLNWTVGADGGSAIITHRIRWKEGSGFYTSWQDIPNSAPSETNATSYTVTGLTNGTAYTFQVRAENGEGESIAPHATSSQVTPSATDTTAPTVIGFFTIGNSPTSADTVTWAVNFDEDVKNVDAADFSVAGTTATLTAAAVTGSTSEYNVTAAGGDLADLDGSVTLSFAATQNIQDIAGNALTNTTPPPTHDQPTYVVDNTAPTVTSVVRQDPASTPTNSDTLTWRVTFNEDVDQLFDSGHLWATFSVAGTTATLAVNRVGDAPTSQYDVTATGGNLASLDATVTLSFAATQNIQDIAGNALTNTTPTVTNDNTFVGGQHRPDGDLDRAPYPDHLADQREQPGLAGNLQRGAALYQPGPGCR